MVQLLRSKTFNLILCSFVRCVFFSVSKMRLTVLRKKVYPLAQVIFNILLNIGMNSGREECLGTLKFLRVLLLFCVDGF